MVDADEILLSPAEIIKITGGYSRQADQLRVLLKRGFFRAAILRGQLVLERSHYDAVTRAALGGSAPARPRLNTQHLKDTA